MTGELKIGTVNALRIFNDAFRISTLNLPSKSTNHAMQARTAII
nr:hypothetical protein [Escherichia coli]